MSNFGTCLHVQSKPSLAFSVNEAPRSKLRGIKAEFAEANPPSL